MNAVVRRALVACALMLAAGGATPAPAAFGPGTYVTCSQHGDVFLDPAVAERPGRDALATGAVPRAVGAVPGGATSHGTLCGYDQQVPIVLWGKGMSAGEHARAVTPADIAPARAFLFGVTLAGADGEIPVEALAPPLRAVQPGR